MRLVSSFDDAADRNGITHVGGPVAVPTASIGKARPERRLSPPGVTALVYRPARSACQSGPASGRDWVLEPRPRSAPETEPLLGWTASNDTLQQVRLTFSSLDRAIAFAERQGWAVIVRTPHQPRFRPKLSADLAVPERHGIEAPTLSAAELPQLAA